MQLRGLFSLKVKQGKAVLACLLLLIAAMFQRPMPQAAMNVHAAFFTKMICMNFVKNPSNVSTHELTWNFRKWERIALPSTQAHETAKD